MDMAPMGEKHSKWRWKRRRSLVTGPMGRGPRESDKMPEHCGKVQQRIRDHTHTHIQRGSLTLILTI